MPEPVPLGSEPPAPPDEPVRFAWLDGVLEGRRGDPAELQRAATTLSGLGLVSFDLRIEGGRFSLLPDDGAFPGERLDDARRRTMHRCLQDVVAAAAEPAAVVSTLRLTEVGASRVRETLFLPRGGELEAVTRVRRAEPRDHERAGTARRPPLLGLGGPRLAVVAVTMTAALVLLVWQSGVLDRVLAPAAETLSIDRGPFEDLLAVEVGDAMGSYVVAVSAVQPTPARGSGSTPLESAARSALSGGRPVWVRLVDGEGRVLAFAGLPLAPLLADPRSTVEARLPGRRDAAGVELGLDPGAR